MTTQPYRLRFEEASASQSGNQGHFSPDNLSSFAPTAFSISNGNVPGADFYPAMLPVLPNGDNAAFKNEETSQAFGNKNDENQPSAIQAEVRKMIDERMNSLRIYVLESDITQAQQAVKSVIELASF